MNRKSSVLMQSVEFCMATGKSIAIGADNVDACYDRLKAEYPDAKLSERDGYVLVERAA